MKTYFPWVVIVSLYEDYFNEVEIVCYISWDINFVGMIVFPVINYPSGKEPQIPIGQEAGWAPELVFII
jgi:hypothetical protein